jgi:hypothetical protein
MDNNKQKKLENYFFGLFKWKINKEELKNQVENYNTLDFFNSSRKIATTLVALGIIILWVIDVFSFPIWANALLVLILPFFIYRGNEYVMIFVMVFSLVVAGLQIIDSLFLNFGPSVIGYSICWAIFIGSLWRAYQVEEYKEKVQINESLENKIKEGKTTIIGWYNKLSDYFFCSKCFTNMDDIETEGHKPIIKESLENDIYTCDKCGKVFGGISTREKVKKTTAMILGILVSIAIIFYGFSMFYLAGFSMFFFWIAFLFLTLGILVFRNSVRLEKSNTFKNSKNLIYIGIFLVIFSIYYNIDMCFKHKNLLVFFDYFSIIGTLSMLAGFLGIDTDKVKREEYYLEKKKKLFKILKILFLLIFLFLIGVTVFNFYFNDIDKTSVSETMINKARDARIISCIGQARTIMHQVYIANNNYDNFSYSNYDINLLCREIIENHPIKHSTGEINPIIAISPASSSTDACIYSLLNSKENYWYCADSTGHAGLYSGLKNNPATTCRIDGTSAYCPFSEDENVNWDIYKNEKYGFEFKYPEGWELSEIFTSSDMFPSYPVPEQDFLPIKITIRKRSAGLYSGEDGPGICLEGKIACSLDITTTFKISKKYNQDFEKELAPRGQGPIYKIKIGGENALKYVLDVAPGSVILRWLLRDGKGFAFTSSASCQDDCKFDQILSTFRFIE